MIETTLYYMVTDEENRAIVEATVTGYSCDCGCTQHDLFVLDSALLGDEPVIVKSNEEIPNLLATGDDLMEVFEMPYTLVDINVAHLEEE